MKKKVDLEMVSEGNLSDPCLMATRSVGIRTTMPVGVDCPLNCKHCYQNGISQYSMDLETNLLNIKRMAKDGVSKLYWDGAEPMTNKNVLDYLSLIEQLKNSGNYDENVFATVSIATSGVLVNKDNAQRLFDSGLSSIMVSLDGGTENTHDSFRSRGVFKKVMRAIDTLVNVGYDVRLGTALWQGMLEEVEEIVRIGADKGVKEVSFNWVQPVGNALKIPGILVDNCYFRDVANTVSEIEEKYSGIVGVNMHRRNEIDGSKMCKGGKQITYVAEDWVAPCSWMNVVAPEFRSKMSLKNFGLQEILDYDENIQRFRSLVEDISSDGALCPAICKMYNGSYVGPDPNSKNGVFSINQVSLR